MLFTTYTTTLALAATLATRAEAVAVTGNTVYSDLMVTLDWMNAATCGGKNPWANVAIDALCNGPGSGDANGITVGTDWTQKGVQYQGYLAQILNNNCPSNSVWVPWKYCEAQFHYLCANIGGVTDGVGEMKFGSNECQTFKISHIPGTPTWTG